MPEETRKLLTPQQVKHFQEKIYTFFGHNKRIFIWRNIDNPYYVMLSEIMLQQTQTSRVTTKYQEFIKSFPTLSDLATAELSEVIALWHGLGYNRRAKNLLLAAQKITNEHQGKLPNTYQELIALPGIGSATAGAILCYAFDTPFPFIETNIRTVFIHEFLNDKENVSDKEIIQYVRETIDSDRPREWFYALTDYGVYLKSKYNYARKSTVYRRQSRYEGSNRQKRSAILKLLLKGPFSKRKLADSLKLSSCELEKPLKELCHESFVIYKNGKYQIT